MAETIAKRFAKQDNRIYRRLAWALKVVALVYFAILGGLMLMERRLVFPGADKSRGDWSYAGIDLDEVEFQSEDGTKLFGCFLAQPDSKNALLICHGNAENIALLATEADRMRSKLKMNVFVFDYRGFGKSSGESVENGVLADGQAATEWLAKRVDCDPKDIVYFGRSLGGGVAVDLVSRHGGKALLLDRTFSSAVDVAASRYWWLPIRLVMRNQFLSIAKIGKYRGPLIQLHGDVDEVIPLWSAQRLHEFSPSAPKEFCLEKGLYHNQPMPETYLDEISQFLTGLDK
jgi:fermentation-respiration switch protein FrsA (DUF1100 family)